MTRAGVVAFSEKGSGLAAFLIERLALHGVSADGFAPPRYAKGAVSPFEELGALTEELFSDRELLIFIGACGIAVRAIAPYVKSKLTDPGVLVADECGTYVISLLSGHVGRANAYARLVAGLLGAVPVVTTATDTNGLFAVDDWAAEQGLFVATPHLVKEISARILAGEPVGFFSELPVAGQYPPSLLAQGLTAEAGVVVSYERTLKKFPLSCHLVPMDLVVGIGCRKGKSAASLRAFLEEVLAGCGLIPERIGLLASADRKAEEDGLIELARALRVPFVTYRTDELARAEGDFPESDFVRRTVGIGNVCERSACLGSGNGRRLIGKRTCDGMAVAVYERRMSLTF